MTKLLRDRYESLATVGAGAQGEVLRARDHLHDRHVALKVRHVHGDAEREELLREARLLLKIRPHPAMTLAREDFFIDDRYYLVMDWIEGEDLGAVLRRRGSLPLKETLALLRSVAGAIDHLHHHDPPIAHRDVKPANIILRPDGDAVLVDFGISGDRGPLQGTPAFVAPEVLAGEEAGAASDIFALAVTAYRALTGVLPEPGASPDWSAIGDAERLAQAFARGLSFDPARRPRSATELIAMMEPPTTPNNLPAMITSFIGRDRETAEVRRHMDASRLVTLTGAGGSGKTRLGLEVAREAMAATADGAWLVELAPLADGDHLARSIASVLGIVDDGDPMQAVLQTLRDKKSLLILDNCEHLIDSVAVLVETLLRSCGQLRVLATSREPLDITGEATFRVPSLAVPPADATDVARYAAVALFLARARDSAPGCGSTVEDLALAAGIARQLDGIPLAIEMAAARVRDLPLNEIAATLHDRVLALRGRRTALPRHKTLEATLAWSYDLLEQPAQALLRDLCVFAGGAFPDAIAAIARDDATAASLDRLASASMVVVEQRGGKTRFRLLEPVRQYATSLAEDLGELHEIRQRHFDWFWRLPGDADVRYASAAWLEIASAEIDNFREALRWAITENQNVTAGLTLASELGPLWGYHGHSSEGRGWLQDALSRASEVPDEELSKARSTLGNLARRSGDLAEALRQHELSLEINRRSGNPHRTAVSLHNVANILVALGDIEGGRARFEESMPLRRAVGDEQSLALALIGLGVVEFRLQDLAAAERHLEEAISILRRGGDPLRLGQPLNNLAVIKLENERFDEADALLDESMEVRQQTGDVHGITQTLWNKGLVQQRRGDKSEALRYLREALELSDRIGDRFQAVQLIDGIADLMWATEPARAATLWGAAVTVAEVPASFKSAVEKAIKECRDGMGEEAFEAARARGRSLSYGDAVELALQPSAQPTSASTDSGISKFE
jgi:predicted ATPase/tRNA A-37 threonylcarbamoyl transferase component Bud32